MTPEETRKLMVYLDGIQAALETISFTLKVLQGQITGLDETLGEWEPGGYEYGADDAEE
jgi:hypothetical protein